MATAHFPPLAPQARPPQGGVRSGAHRPLNQPHSQPAGTPPPSWEELLGRR